MRSSGVLLHIASLDSDYGIGSFGKSAYKFIDFLKFSGQRYWQVLPMGPTGYGDSPYQSFSTFAGNPYFIDLDSLVDDGLLDKELLSGLPWGNKESKIYYQQLYSSRLKVWSIAFDNFIKKPNLDFDKFCEKESFWLDDYSVYMSLSLQNKTSWHNWDSDIRQHEDKAILKYKLSHKKEITFWKFLQFEFFTQWKNLKKYANENGIYIIGDLPIYVSDDSSDVWSHTELFDLKEDLSLKNVAGVPPDAFSEDGQLWGNPVYNWQAHKKTNYKWWKARLAAAYKLYDVVRIDHFRGFESFYSIPSGSDNAKNGKWIKGPGAELFHTLKMTNTGKFNVIAEDLGVITPEVRKMVNECGYPGMKILHFAFGADLENNNGEYLPHSISENSVVYTGTHDNMTTLQWWHNEPKENKEFCLEYTNWEFDDDICDKMISLAYSTRAKLAIIPMQDWLGLDEDARMNTPSTVNGNWQWRMSKNSLSSDLSERILRKTKIYNR